MTPNFLKAYAYLKENEGDFSNDTNDSGGPTMKGITLEEYSRWLQRPISIEELKKIPEDHVQRIYFQWYWTPMGLNHVINSDVACAIFDQGVNRGVRTTILAVQKIVGVKADGHIGPITINAINSFKDGPAKLIEEISAQAEGAYKQIVARKPSQIVFLKGWLNRAKRLLKLKGEK